MKMDPSTEHSLKRGFNQSLIITLWIIIFNILQQSLVPILTRAALLMLLLTFIAWIVVQIVSKRTIVIPHFFLPLMMLLPLQLLLLSRSPINQTGPAIISQSIILVLSFIMVFNLLKDSGKTFVWEQAILSVGIIHAVMGLWYYFTWSMSWWEISHIFSPPPVGNRLGGAFIGHANIFAAFLNLLLPIALIRLLRSKQRAERAIWSLVLVLFLSAIFLTSSRGGWIGAAVACSISSLVYYAPTLVRHYQSKRITFTSLLSGKKLPAIGLSVALLGLVLIAMSRQIQRASKVPILFSRGYIWKPALNAIKGSPIWGNGPGSFSVIYTSFDAPPPHWNTNHAHNLLLQIWVELGIPGIILVLAAALILARSIFRILQRDLNSAVKLAPFIGALTGMLIHHLFDYAFINLIFLLSVLLISSFILFHDSERRDIQLSPYIASITSSILIITLMTISLQSFKASSEYWKGIAPARKGQWEISKEAFCKSASSSPRNTFYAIQCATAEANSIRTEPDPDYQSSINMLSNAIEADPYWPIHTANLAYLYWEQGDPDSAITLMWKAAQSAPDLTVLRLNLALMLEAEDNETAAATAFYKSMESDPYLAFSHLMQQTSLRSSITDVFISDVLEEPGNFFNLENSEYASFDWLGFYSLTLKDYENAQYYFERSQDAHSAGSNSLSGLAEVSLMRGELEQATMLIRHALFISPSSYSSRFVYGRILREQRLEDQAAEQLRIAFSELSGKTYSLQYYGYAYNKYSPHPDLLVFFRTGDITRQHVMQLQWLAEIEAGSGSNDMAETILEYLSRESSY